jgi:hypothetical protein
MGAKKTFPSSFILISIHLIDVTLMDKICSRAIMKLENIRLISSRIFLLTIMIIFMSFSDMSSAALKLLALAQALSLDGGILEFEEGLHWHGSHIYPLQWSILSSL